MIRNAKFLMISLLCSSTALHTMEIKTWDYKEKDKSCLSYFLPEQPWGQKNRKFPCFLPEKDESASKRSFSDELLFAKRVVETILCKDVADTLLRYSYKTEKTFDSDTKKFLFNTLKINTADTFYLTRGGKQALLYLTEQAILGQAITIEGIDKDFSQKMSQHILELPLPIRREIAEQYGANMLCNTEYEPSMRNTLLGEDENTHVRNKDRLARITQLATKGTIAIFACYFGIPAMLSFSDENAALMSVTGGSVFSALEAHTISEDFSNYNNITKEALALQRCGRQAKWDMKIAGASGVLSGLRNSSLSTGIETAGTMGVGSIVGMGVTEYAGMCAYNKMLNYLEESPEERSLRLGFTTYPLLQKNEK